MRLFLLVIILTIGSIGSANAALCNDGTNTPSTGGPGTCSWHGGEAGNTPSYRPSYGGDNSSSHYYYQKRGNSFGVILFFIIVAGIVVWLGSRIAKTNNLKNQRQKIATDEDKMIKLSEMYEQGTITEAEFKFMKKYL